VHALIGEGRYNERVEPLDSQGLSTRDRALISMIIGAAAEAFAPDGGGGTSVTVNIDGQQLRGVVAQEVKRTNDHLARSVRNGRRGF
jgi:hypothetical protein